MTFFFFMIYSLMLYTSHLFPFLNSPFDGGFGEYYQQDLVIYLSDDERVAF